jgi:hypothetical protein
MYRTPTVDSMADDMRPDIAAAKSRMNMTIGSKREMKRLPEHLWEGETVAQMTGGSYGNGTGLIVLTDRRLFFFQDGVMSKKSEDFPFTKISSVQWSSGLMFGSIVIFASGNKAEISNVDKKDGKAMVDTVRGMLSAVEQSAPTPATASPASAPAVSLIDQIRQLGELWDAGIVTPEEFEAKKAELLSRI